MHCTVSRHCFPAGQRRFRASGQPMREATAKSIGARHVAANCHPDHVTIRTFRRNSFDAVAEAFLQGTAAGEGVGTAACWTVTGVSSPPSPIALGANRRHARPPERHRHRDGFRTTECLPGFPGDSRTPSCSAAHVGGPSRRWRRRRDGLSHDHHAQGRESLLANLATYHRRRRSRRDPARGGAQERDPQCRYPRRAAEETARRGYPAVARRRGRIAGIRPRGAEYGADAHGRYIACCSTPSCTDLCYRTPTSSG